LSSPIVTDINNKFSQTLPLFVSTLLHLRITWYTFHKLMTRYRSMLYWKTPDSNRYCSIDCFNDKSSENFRMSLIHIMGYCCIRFIKNDIHNVHFIIWCLQIVLPKIVLLCPLKCQYRNVKSDIQLSQT
jgi:hypothetical protein